MTSQNRNYRVWTNIEENKLVEALVNMVNTGGFKADNGFKSGYLAHLEQVLKESLPESGILGKPHIESKIKVMKKDWQVVHDMLHGSNTSGFGFDSVKQCVNAGDQVWESYLESHKGAAKWRNKSFPHYEDLCIVFGKDRAQGSNARDALEMQEEANMKEQTQYFLEDETSSHIPHSHANVQSEETSSARTKKRKTRVDPMVEGFKDAVTYLGDSLEKISNKINRGIEREEELDNKRSMITSEISKMQSLTQPEKFKAITKIRDDSEKVKVFWDLQEMDREPFVKWVLEE